MTTFTLVRLLAAHHQRSLYFYVPRSTAISNHLMHCSLAFDKLYRCRSQHFLALLDVKRAFMIPSTIGSLSSIQKSCTVHRRLCDLKGTYSCGLLSHTPRVARVYGKTFAGIRVDSVLAECRRMEVSGAGEVCIRSQPTAREENTHSAQNKHIRNAIFNDVLMSPLRIVVEKIVW